MSAADEKRVHKCRFFRLVESLFHHLLNCTSFDRCRETWSDHLCLFARISSVWPVVSLIIAFVYREIESWVRQLWNAQERQRQVVTASLETPVQCVI